MEKRTPSTGETLIQTLQLCLLLMVKQVDAKVEQQGHFSRARPPRYHAVLGCDLVLWYLLVF